MIDLIRHKFEWLEPKLRLALIWFCGNDMLTLTFIFGRFQAKEAAAGPDCGNEMLLHFPEKRDPMLFCALSRYGLYMSPKVVLK